MVGTSTPASFSANQGRIGAKPIVTCSNAWFPALCAGLIYKLCVMIGSFNRLHPMLFVREINLVLVLKASANEEHCCGKHFFLKCFLGAQMRKHLLRKQNVSEPIQKHFYFPGSKFCFHNKCFLGPQTGKHSLVQQCFRQIVSSFASELKDRFAKRFWLCILQTRSDLMNHFFHFFGKANLFHSVKGGLRKLSPLEQSPIFRFGRI